MPLSGHCLCKAVTYTVDVDAPLVTGYDHCDDCQRQSGSTYSLVAVVPKDKLTIQGPTKSWAGKGSSGLAVHRIFCSECGSPIAHDPDAAPEIIAIKAGTLDTEIKKNLKPDTEIWTVGKLPFCQENLARPFKHMPDNRRIFVGKVIQPILWVCHMCFTMSGTLFIHDSRTYVNYEIPINQNSVRAIDLQRIRAPSLNSNHADQLAHGLRVYDPGLQNTAVTQSAISFSDHENSLLLYRGYTLDQLWGCDFEEMFHLLLWGKYPTASQSEELRQRLAQYMQEVPDIVRQTIFNLPKTTSPLPLIIAGLSAYLACILDVIPATTNATVFQTDFKRADQVILQTAAAYAVVFGAVRSHRIGIPWRSPSPHQTYYENLFTMAGLVDPETNRPDPIRVSCFRRFGNLNAEHGMALSVFSALVTASSLTDPVSCLISAVAAAHGPLHFGATESAQRALHDIGELENVPAFIEEIKAGKRKLFGYGHRTYKGMDPRVRPIQSILKDLAYVHQPLLKVAEAIEETAAKDDYFSARGLYPNADFYGQFVFTGIGFEPDIIPAAMLAHRIMGIMAHWREYMVTRGKLFRPTHLYTGYTELNPDPRAKI
ncbi:Citrate synthase-like, core [Penicillium griseofulvum]|uniref:Citrate synthase-like, core n=1 Tax=Penicillium patulum TaxID=5078 RepID=A0A135LSS1_PENPA|nr:Citrate synthase-like, core [Penicillium griseofulvum]KXG51976.1 Citrate synthase-like, core [Penicillium griseofulvum]